MVAAPVLARTTHCQNTDRSIAVDVASQVIERTALTAALEELAPRQRAVLVLRFYEDLTIDRVADVLGISASSVTTHVARGLAALRAGGLLEGREGAHHG